LTVAESRKLVRRPLALSTYLLRNASKTVPLTFVIVLAVMLVGGIIAMINSIPYSINTIYGYSKNLLGVTPRGDPSLTASIVERIKSQSPVPVERAIICRGSSAEVRSIVGKWPFFVLGLPIEEMDYYLGRMGSSGVEGRLPEAGLGEAVISRPVAQNLGLSIGEVLLAPDIEGRYSPNEVKVVGIAETENWLMFTSKQYHELYHFPPVDFAIIFARNQEEQRVLDLWAEEEFKGERAQILAYHQVEKESDEMFVTLYKILNVVIGTLVLVITFMMGMLMNIYQSQRLVEFGLLQALGYTRRQLLRRVMVESVAMIVLGWVFGLLLCYGLLRAVKAILMDPNAFALNPFDAMALAYTIPIPVAIFCAALITVLLRFRNFDPVGVVERRLV
jgi:ABC-type lipoprotein release transport system permease subunit